MVSLQCNNKPEEPFRNRQQQESRSPRKEAKEQAGLEVDGDNRRKQRRRADKETSHTASVVNNGSVVHWNESKRSCEDRGSIPAPSAREEQDDEWKSSDPAIVRRRADENKFTSRCGGPNFEVEDDEETESIRLAQNTEEEKVEASEIDDDEMENESNGWIRKKIVTTRIEHEGNFNNNDDDHGVDRVMPNLDETSFGEVTIANSNHVHVGNTNFYKGPVTIKQFVYTNSLPIRYEDASTKENSIEDNNKIDACNGRISDVSPNDIPHHVKGDSKRPILPTYDDYEKVTKWLWTWRCAVILCVLALSSVTIVVVAAVLLPNMTRGGSREITKLPESPDSGVDPDIWVDSVRFVERREWIGQPPTEKLSKLTEVPAPYVIISHTATEPCMVQSECVLRVRLIQTYHIESRGWSDIGYNFLIGGDGLAYVGRSWDYEGAHAFGWNKKSIGISVIGTFNDVPPDKRQLHALKKVIETGVELGKISANYTLLAHRQVSETLSPGDQLYNILTTWDHWSPIPPPSRPSRASALIRPLHRILVSSTVLSLLLPRLLLHYSRSRFGLSLGNEFASTRSR